MSKPVVACNSGVSKLFALRAKYRTVSNGPDYVNNIALNGSTFKKLTTYTDIYDDE